MSAVDDPGRNPVWRALHPRTVADLTALHHQGTGSLTLTLRRADAPAVAAVAAAVRRQGATVERAERSMLRVVWERGDLNAAGLLAAPLEALPLPPPRVSASLTAAKPRLAVWAALTSSDGPPWRPPAMVRVVPRAGEPPAWDITIALGIVSLPHQMVQTAAAQPAELELTISGKLNAVVRYTLGEEATGCLVQQDIWFAIEGRPIEAAVGEAVVGAMARQFGPGHLRALVG